MGIFGEIGLGGLGSAIGQYFGGSEGRDVGNKIGSWVGNKFVPFKKGGFTTMPVVSKKLRKGGMAEMDGYKKGGVVPNHVPMPMNYMGHVISPPQRFYGNRAQL